jgi:zinc/manganese transport system substrate-binding protein
MLTRRAAVSLLAGCLTLAASSLPVAAQNADKLKVVATFSILGDMVRNIGGERVEVATLVGPNGDAHVYSPTPADGRRLTEAKIVFTNGLKFEGWIDRLVKKKATGMDTIMAMAAPIRMPGRASAMRRSTRPISGMP